MESLNLKLLIIDGRRIVNKSFKTKNDAQAYLNQLKQAGQEDKEHKF